MKTATPEQAADPIPPELEAYTAYQRRRGLSPVTIELRESLVLRLAAWLGERPLSSARAEDLRRYVAWRREQIGKVSQASEISYLKSFYSALHKLELIDEDPSLRLHSWRPESSRRPLTLQAVQALLTEANRPVGGAGPKCVALALRDRACLELLFATGMRASEVCASQVVDVDLGDGSILVRRAKGGGARRLPLPKPAVVALRRWVNEGRGKLLGQSADPGALFVSRFGTPLDTASLRVLVIRVGKRCGIKAFPHVFRRTLATELAAAGVSLPSIQKVLGHASLTMTSEYISVRDVQMRDALQAFVAQRPGCSKPLLVPGGVQCRLFREWQVPAA